MTSKLVQAFEECEGFLGGQKNGSHLSLRADEACGPRTLQVSTSAMDLHLTPPSLLLVCFCLLHIFV